MILAVLLVLSVLTGCANMTTTEKIWYAEHVLDIGQTVEITKSPCHYENDPLTRRLIGENPTESDVYKWGVASGLAYWIISRAIDKYHPEYKKYWDTITISLKTKTVINNEDIGLHFDSHRC
jgi:hypothetical protein